MPDNYSGIDFWLVIIGVMLIAGVIKGIIGMGLPIIASALYTLFFPAHYILGLIVIPLCLSNLLQATQSGQFKWVLSRFWLFLLCLIVGILISSLYTRQVNERIIYAILALAIVLFLVSQLKPNIPLTSQSEHFFSAFYGLLAGVFAGLSASWGPATVIYLGVLKLTKQQFITATGWIFLIGSLPLLYGYINSGILTVEMVPAALVASLAVVCGFLLGKRVRNTISEKKFSLLVNIMMAVIALNLARKAFL